jgi:2-polyprenyl-3-methyl-5-hydroxy-6-metoxy-1,4-benzoquinol methylase
VSKHPTYVEFARANLRKAEDELVARFGRASLEETAFSVYTNSFPPAEYLGWSRIVHAQRLLGVLDERRRALDFGSGLAVMLPFLSQTFETVVAHDLDPGPTTMMIERMRLTNVEATTGFGDDDALFDAVVALDVLEHVSDLDGIYANLLRRTAPGGCWVISGPSENWLYRGMRKIARTTGEGHVRTIFDVLDAVPSQMRRTDSVKLPFGSPVPLFVVAKFERTAA